MLKQGTPRICKHTHSQSHQSLVEDDFWHLVDGFLWYGKHDWNEHLKYSDGFHSRPKVDLVRKHLTSHAQSDWVVSKRPYRCDDVSSEAPNHQHSSERKNPKLWVFWFAACPFGKESSRAAGSDAETRWQGWWEHLGILPLKDWITVGSLFVRLGFKCFGEFVPFLKCPPKKFTGQNGSFLLFGPLEKKTSSFFFFRKVETRWVCFSRLASPKLCWSTKVGKDCFSDVSFGNPRVSPMESPPVFPGGGREQWASEFGGLGTRVVPGVHPTSLTYGRLIFALEA